MCPIKLRPMCHKCEVIHLVQVSIHHEPDHSRSKIDAIMKLSLE
jgi:hypothetical protein